MQRIESRMYLRVVLAAAIGSGLLLLSGCQSAQGQAPAQDEDKALERAAGPDTKEISTKQEDRPLKSIRLLKTNAGRAEWSPDDKYITYHAKGEDGYYDAYIMKSDGTDVRCLTCDHKDLPNKNVGQPSWHPSGAWIAFQAEKQNHMMPGFGRLAAPGIGFHNDVWVMTADGKKAYQLTDLVTKKTLLDRTPTSAILQPHFSRDGKLLSWSEKVGDGGKWGKWVIRVADFVVGKDGVPTLRKMRTFTPGANALYFESNDFMPGNRLLICGNLEPNQTELGIDIYYLDLATKKTERLTHSQDTFEECPHPSPDGSRIAYLSTEGFGFSKDGEAEPSEHWWNWARGEFWLMDAKGGHNTRLTHFNQEGYPEYTGKRVLPAYVSWNNAGDKLLLGVGTEVKGKSLEDQLYIVELNDASRPPDAATPLPQRK